MSEENSYTNSNTISQTEGENMIDGEKEVTPFKKLIDPYSTIAKNSSSSLFSCYSRVQEDIIPEDIKKDIILEGVLANKKTLKYFKIFCISDYSVENLLLYEAVQLYNNIFLTKVFDENGIAKSIMKTFFEKGFINKLNTSSRLIRKCVNDYTQNGAKEDLFDDNLSNIISEQLSDTFTRF